MVILFSEPHNRAALFILFLLGLLSGWCGIWLWMACVVCMMITQGLPPVLGYFTLSGFGVLCCGDVCGYGDDVVHRLYMRVTIQWRRCLQRFWMRCFVGTHLLAAGIKPMASGKAERVRPHCRVYPMYAAVFPCVGRCVSRTFGRTKVRPYIATYNRYSGTLATFAVMFVVFVLGW